MNYLTVWMNRFRRACLFIQLVLLEHSTFFKENGLILQLPKSKTVEFSKLAGD